MKNLINLRRKKKIHRVRFCKSKLGRKLKETYYKACGRVCFYCGKQFENNYKNKSTFDHIDGVDCLVIAKEKGEDHIPFWTVLISCQECNENRDHLPLQEFIDFYSLSTSEIKKRWIKYSKVLQCYVQASINENYMALIYGPNHAKKRAVYLLHRWGQKYKNEFLRINNMIMNLK